jgi:hypothetical protein
VLLLLLLVLPCFRRVMGTESYMRSGAIEESEESCGSDVN